VKPRVKAPAIVPGTIRIVNGVEYVSKDVAAQRCRELSATIPGCRFANYAHCKRVERPLNEQETAEQAARRAAGLIFHRGVTVMEWNKLYAGSRVLSAHPELRGLWVRADLDRRAAGSRPAVEPTAEQAGA
jgi:hypothetical protein